MNNTHAQISRIKIWINAFIPGDLEGSMYVPGDGAHAGKTMLATPGIAGMSFLTDQRGFSTDIDAHSRMHSEIEIDLEQVKIIHEHHECHETVEVNSDNGDEQCNDCGSTDNMQFELSETGNGIIKLNVKGSARNPCLKVANVKISPNLDYEGTITIRLLESRRRAHISFEGKVEVYPSFEMYACADDGEVKAIFQAETMPDKSPLDLVGAPARDVSGQVQLII